MAEIEVAVLGPGAIGGFLAAVLKKSGKEVICISDIEGPLKRAISLDSPVFGKFSAEFEFRKALDRPARFIFVTTKAYHLEDALSAIPKNFAEGAVVIPLLNGIGHLEILREYFGPKVIAGTIGAIEVKRGEKQGEVFHLSPHTPIVELASKDIPGKVGEVADILRSAGIKAEVLESEAEVIWRKLVRLAAIAGTTAAAQKSVGFIRSDPKWRELLEGAVREGTAIANKEGVDISADEILRQIDALPEALGTSLQNDIKNNLPSERDAILGGVIERGQHYKIPTPSLKHLFDILSSTK